MVSVSCFRNYSKSAESRKGFGFYTPQSLASIWNVLGKEA